ncbi:GntR family transcriptional regulator [Spongiactinospora rosea]|uniref:GntR family transcriptional regulator n=1 Tax=Spongiactinospora rosea TaxID=2248750 RepID=A0A366LJH2_9ACTN|nr:GntR family transcriptional regulator [Spongiactinospora rosea]RBQ14037.1 GntR family transcriptional regulator [Spongiactinospora rosea]
MSPSSYHEVAEAIRTAIHTGVYPRGTLLPTEEQLAEELAVHRATVNRALTILKNEGLVRVERGVGTRVHELPPILRDAAVRHSREHRERGGARGALASELVERGYQLDSDNTIGPGRPPEHVADLLGVAPDADSVIIRARRMRADGVPIQIVTSYIPRTIADGTPIAEQDPGAGGISSRLAELGHAQAEIEERIRVRPPLPEERRFLRMSSEQWVYDIVHIGWTADDRAVKVNTYILPIYQWDLRYRYRIDPA